MCLHFQPIQQKTCRNVRAGCGFTVCGAKKPERSGRLGLLNFLNVIQQMHGDAAQTHIDSYSLSINGARYNAPTCTDLVVQLVRR
jgi:hypothetical protein